MSGVLGAPLSLSLSSTYQYCDFLFLKSILGNSDAAIAVLRDIFKTNGVAFPDKVTLVYQTSPNLEMSDPAMASPLLVSRHIQSQMDKDIPNELPVAPALKVSYLDLFSPRLRWITTPLVFVWMANTFVYYGMVIIIPTLFVALQDHTWCDQSVFASLSSSSSSLSAQSLSSSSSSSLFSSPFTSLSTSSVDDVSRSYFDHSGETCLGATLTTKDFTGALTHIDTLTHAHIHTHAQYTLVHRLVHTHTRKI